MYYRKLTPLKTNRELVDVFRGYNHNPRISDGEFYDMKNLTSDHYPLLAPRGKRGLYAAPENTQGIIAKDVLCYADGADFVVGENRIAMELSTAEEDCPKRLTSMGAYVIIMPDKKYINTQNPEDFGEIESTFVSTDTVKFDVCDADGVIYKSIWFTSDNPGVPNDPERVWIDTSVKPYALKAYSAATGVWVPITPYTTISSAGIGKQFSLYDGVTISGITNQVIVHMNGDKTIRAIGDDYIVVDGLINGYSHQEPEEGTITVARRMPNVDFLIESENRLWGCRYGTALNGEFVNEIYASALGDFRNWNRFMGASADSYVASCGTDGAFTGAITLDGYPLFWKEGFVHKIYGNYPANFQIQTTACRGVQKGCEGSLAIVNERLYYKSRSGICAYDGSLPTEVSYALGTEVYHDAVAGGCGNKYYICMKDAADNAHLFVYDTVKGLWHREDDFRADGFCSLKGELYAIDHDSRKILAMLGSGESAESAISWAAQTGVLGLAMPDNKYISRLNIRMSLALGTRVRFLIQYDSVGSWHHLSSMSGTSLQSFTVPIRPRRCDHFRLRIEGIGEARIYSIAKTIEQGSDSV